MRPNSPGSLSCFLTGPWETSCSFVNCLWWILHGREWGMSPGTEALSGSTACKKTLNFSIIWMPLEVDSSFAKSRGENAAWLTDKFPAAWCDLGAKNHPKSYLIFDPQKQWDLWYVKPLVVQSQSHFQLFVTP